MRWLYKGDFWKKEKMRMEWTLQTKVSLKSVVYSLGAIGNKVVEEKGEQENEEAVNIMIGVRL